MRPASSLNDLNALRYGAVFAQHKDRLYPPELTLNQTTVSTTSTHFLDLTITAEHKQYVSKIYDKRDDYKFAIVNFPHLDANIPKKPAYGVFISQVLRYFSGCTHYADFADRVRTLQLRLSTQGYRKSGLLRAVDSLMERRGNIIFHKWKVRLAKFIADCIK